MKRAFLSGMVLALCLNGAYAAAAKPVKRAKPVRSVKPVKPVISIKIDEGTPRYVYERERIECSGNSERTAGCTHTSPYIEYGDIRYTSDGGLAGLELRFGLKDVMIEISTKMKKGTCEFDTVVKHELTHLNLHRRVLKHHAAEIAKSVLAALERMPPSVALQKEWDVIGKVVKAGFKRMNDDIDRNDALMDSAGAYVHQYDHCYGKNGN